jgi:hypothetical protein
MTKCETRKQLSYSWLGTGNSQENGGSNLPLVWQSLIVSVLSVFVDFPFWMRLGVRYHCYYLYSVVCQQIWRNVLPLFFPRYTGVQGYTIERGYCCVINNSSWTTEWISIKLPEFLMLSFSKHYFFQKFFCTYVYVAVGLFFSSTIT